MKYAGLFYLPRLFIYHAASTEPAVRAQLKVMERRLLMITHIGGALAHYMDARKVRVYIKDSLLKPYERARLSGTEQQILGRLGIPAASEVGDRYIKPHGLVFADGRIVSWGNSRDWKLVLMAMFERAASRPGSSAFGAVLLENGKTSDAAIRKMVREAARRLGIERMEWID